MTEQSAAPQTDERLKEISFTAKLMKRPELGAVAGLVLITIFFLIFGSSNMFTLAGIFTWMAPAALLGILALGAAMLMIGGEFDLSVGSMIAFIGFIFAFLLVNIQLPLIFAILLTFAFAALAGYGNGQLVIRTGLPSFIVTLAFLFIFRGLSLVGLKWSTGGSTQLRGIRDVVEGSWIRPLFSGDAFPGLFTWLADIGLIAKFPTGKPTVEGIPVEIIWFFVLTLIISTVLLKTRIGNWVFAAGGDANAAANSGVPVRAVKTGLFMLTACCAALYAIITVLDAGSTDAGRGRLKEFEAIIAAVIGGCLLTGGYGSVIGAAIGAIIFGMVAFGLNYIAWIDKDWFQVFMGGMLLVAVLFNNMIRKRVTGER